MDIPERQSEEEYDRAHLLLLSILTNLILVRKTQYTLKLNQQNGPVNALNLLSV